MLKIPSGNSKAMELKEYFKILRDNAKIFWGVAIAVVAISFAYFVFRPLAYNVSLTLNITRSGSQATDQYRYDDYYRLQADEKFADTVVEWLKSPRTVAEIYSQSGVNSKQFTLRQLRNLLKPERLSSQIVSVSFSADNEERARKMADAIVEIISQNTKSLNQNQNESAWFEVVAQDPVIVKNVFDPVIVFAAALAAGIFLGFWASLLTHYIK